MSLFNPECEHDYVIIDKEVKESPYELGLGRGVTMRFNGDLPPGLFDKTISRVFKCRKCNKIWVRDDTI